MGYSLPLRLCDACAQDLPVSSDPMTTALTMFQVQLPALQTCPRCSVAFQAICHSTLLGCSYCYTFYRSHLETLLQRVQGTEQHRGKSPLRKGRGHKQRQVISELKERLQQAVEAENYEEAARLRDKIQELSAQ
jgi:protein arginine kinase activator